MVERYQFVTAEYATYPIQTLCKVMNVSRSGYYDWKKRPKKNHQRLILDLKTLHKESRSTYGVPRMTIKIKELGYDIGRHTVQRLMRQENLYGLPLYRKKYRKPTIAHEDLVRRDFTAEHPNQLWCCDITQKWTKKGWLYLAVVLDLYSRKIVGWATDNNMKTHLPLRALNQAVTLRGNPQGVIHHSDRGSQYTSEQYLLRLETANLRPSFGSAGSCLDNAVVESFFSILKRECLHRRAWATREQLREEINNFISTFYNPVRIRSNGKSPIQSEQEYIHNSAQKCA